MKEQFDHLSGEQIHINGADIYYEQAGNHNKPALLLLHGGFENIENLNPIVRWLAEEFLIIGIDSRGHGKSTLGTQPLTYREIQSDVEKILISLKIKELSILGFSDGGIVAYRIAAAKNINVKKLVTIGAAWCENDINESESIMKEITPANAKLFFPENCKRYLELNPKPEFERYVESVVRMWLDRSSSGYPNASVSTIESETLLMRGDRDFLVSLSSLTELQNQIPKASFANIPFSEHLLYEEQPYVLQQLLFHFFDIRD